MERSFNSAEKARAGGFSQAVWALGLGAMALVACETDSASQTVGPYVLAISNQVQSSSPSYEAPSFLVQTQVSLPIRKPLANELTALGGPVGPFSHSPFFLASDALFTFHVTISNLDPTPSTVELLIDPWNEFVGYAPESTGSPSGYDQTFILAGYQRVQWVISPDSVTYMETALAIAQNVFANPPPVDSLFGEIPITQTEATLINYAFNQANLVPNGGESSLVTPYIPSVIPGLTGFTLGIRYDSGAGTLNTLNPVPGNVAIEVFINIQDMSNGTRVLPPGSSPSDFIGPPPAYLAPPPTASQ